MAYASFIQLFFRTPSYPILPGQFKKKPTPPERTGHLRARQPENPPRLPLSRKHRQSKRERAFYLFAYSGKLKPSRVVLCPDGLELVLVVEQDIDQRRIEMLAAFHLEMGKHGVP